MHASKEMTQLERHSVLPLGSIILQGHYFTFDNKLASQQTVLFLSLVREAEVNQIKKKLMFEIPKWGGSSPFKCHPLESWDRWGWGASFPHPSQVSRVSLVLEMNCSKQAKARGREPGNPHLVCSYLKGFLRPALGFPKTLLWLLTFLLSLLSSFFLSLLLVFFLPPGLAFSRAHQLSRFPFL